MAEGRKRQIISQDNPLLAAAAAGELLHDDDTTMRVQSLKKKKAGSERTGIITTKIISKVTADQVALFLSAVIMSEIIKYR